jgi:hypothetical protein
MSHLTPDYASIFIEGTSGPPMTERQINDFEQTFDTVIPPPYKDMLLCRNGGMLARNTFKTPDFDVFLLYLCGIGCPFDDLYNQEDGMLTTTSRIRSWKLPEDSFPFAQFGHFFCYLKNDATWEKSPVFCVFTEIPGAYEYFQLTDTFEEFMSGLETLPEHLEMVERFREAFAAQDAN